MNRRELIQGVTAAGLMASLPAVAEAESDEAETWRTWSEEVAARGRFCVVCEPHPLLNGPQATWAHVASRFTVPGLCDVYLDGVHQLMTIEAMGGHRGWVLNMVTERTLDRYGEMSSRAIRCPHCHKEAMCQVLIGHVEVVYG